MVLGDVLTIRKCRKCVLKLLGVKRQDLYNFVNCADRNRKSYIKEYGKS